MTIFGISVGTDRAGVCILKDELLVERRVHNYRKVWSDDKLHIIIKQYKQYIQKYRVKAIIVKIPPLRKHTPAICLLIKHIERLARDYDCEFDLITKSEIKSVCGLHSTKEIILHTRMLYPELRTLPSEGDKIDHGYYKKLYEAVLSAHIYQDRQRIRRLRNDTTE